jgi:hypothetical protein
MKSPGLKNKFSKKVGSHDMSLESFSGNRRELWNWLRR